MGNSYEARPGGLIIIGAARPANTHTYTQFCGASFGGAHA